LSAPAIDRERGRVRAPRPLLSAERERRLTARQRQIIDDLEALVVRGDVADKTMADLAALVNCSLRTLYGIARGKDDLVLTVVDRRLQRIGRAAIAAMQPAMKPLEALRVYLRAVNEAVQPTTAEFARDFADLPGSARLLGAHQAYVIAVVHSLLDGAIAAGEIASVDAAAIAHVLGGLGREFSKPELIEIIAATPKQTADAITDVILRGLASGKR
jgi:AcrR family transcriptional regulator